MSLLRVDSIVMRFGGLVALNEVSFSIEKGEIHALIGPNGSGKTTTFNVVNRVLEPTSGNVYLNDMCLLEKKKYQINSLGIARTFQHVSLFRSMTVLENVMIGLHSKTKQMIIGALFKTKKAKKEEAEIREKAMAQLEFVGMADKRDVKASNLPFGDQKLLEIARALASEPILMMLDEPAAGMNPAEKMYLSNLILKIRDMGMSVLLIEHDMKLAMSVSEIVTVIDHGEKIAEGLPEEIQNNPKVIEAYLGKRNRHA